jgi:hypothetical protein
LIRRVRGGGFYCVDNNTGKRTSLRTGCENEAIQLVQAKNQAERQPILKLQIAKAYLAGSDNSITTRTLQHAVLNSFPRSVAQSPYCFRLCRWFWHHLPAIKLLVSSMSK